MAHIIADRVKETTFTLGAGPITLAGAAQACQPFSAVMAIGDTCAYAIVSVTGTDWETGIGTYTAPNTLTRTTIHASSQSGSAVLFPDGAKDVFLGPTAKSVPGFNPITNTITSGTWGGNTIDVAHGGTGLTAFGTANQVLAVNPAGTALEYHTITSNPGTVTSVGGTGTVNGLTLSGTVTSSGNLTLGGTLAGVSLASQVTGTLPMANGGTGQATQQAAINALAGATTSGQFLRGNGTNVVMAGISASDVPALNQNTTGTAANITATSNSTLTTLSALSLPGSQVSGNIPGNAANVTGVVAISHGGTGLTALGTANQVVTVNAGGTGLTYSTPQLSTLSDVAVAGLTNGDLLRYDGIAGAWSNTTDVMAANGDSWFTLLRRMNKLMESLTIVDAQQRQRVAVETMPTTTVAGTLSVQSTTGSYTSQLQVVGSGATTTTATTFVVNEGPVDQRWRIVDDARSCYGINIRSRLTFS